MWVGMDNSEALGQGGKIGWIGSDLSYPVPAIHGSWLCCMHACLAVCAIISIYTVASMLQYCVCPPPQDMGLGAPQVLSWLVCIQ